jgi:hypothetical protein
MIVTLSIFASIAVMLVLSLGKFARSTQWRATVTPLASIIGSGFLICGPILAKEFGSAALPAMAVLLLIAYAVGAVIRFNIIHVENIGPTLGLHDLMAWFMRLTQATLAIAYAVSVAYYLKLLAEFTLKSVPLSIAAHELVANLLITTIILMFVVLTFAGNIRKIERAAHASVSIKLSIIAGLLTGLGTWWAMHADASLELPAPRLSMSGIPMLLGLLITVQGFETSRYLGDSYDQATRVKSMRHAQWLSAAIYLAFLALLTPFLGKAQSIEGVAGIVDIMKFVAPVLGIFVLIGAVSSQLSAAIADSIGSGGIMIEVFRQKLSVRHAFIVASALAIAVVWLTDPFQVIALSSRAFALFYAMQAVIALWVSLRTGAGGWLARTGFVLTGLICIIAALVGAPAES